MNGILLIDKPGRWTSHDVVNKVRRILRERRIGHTGTLDPLATGLLVLCIGKATRIARYLESDEKEYRAACRLGVTTDTQDADGRVLETSTGELPAHDDVEKALGGFRGKVRQRPPLYSAIKVRGVPAYRLARQGVVQQLPEREITVRVLRLLGYEDGLATVQVVCSKGTYVRTLCSDIGVRLGCGAHLTSLVRTRAGRFSLDQAWSLDRLSALAEGGQAEDAVLDLNEALADRPGVVVSERDAARILHGNAVTGYPAAADGVPGDRVRLLGPAGTLIAMGVMKDGQIRPEVVLA